MNTATLQTTGEIANLYRVGIHQIRYVVETRRIEATQRAGHFKLFDQEAVEVIGQELAQIESFGGKKVKTDG